MDAGILENKPPPCGDTFRGAERYCDAFVIFRKARLGKL